MRETLQREIPHLRRAEIRVTVDGDAQTAVVVRSVVVLEDSFAAAHDRAACRRVEQQRNLPK